MSEKPPSLQERIAQAEAYVGRVEAILDRADAADIETDEFRQHLAEAKETFQKIPAEVPEKTPQAYAQMLSNRTKIEKAFSEIEALLGGLLENLELHKEVTEFSLGITALLKDLPPLTEELARKIQEVGGDIAYFDRIMEASAGKGLHIEMIPGGLALSGSASSETQTPQQRFIAHASDVAKMVEEVGTLLESAERLHTEEGSLNFPYNAETITAGLRKDVETITANYHDQPAAGGVRLKTFLEEKAGPWLIQIEAAVDKAIDTTKGLIDDDGVNGLRDQNANILERIQNKIDELEKEKRAQDQAEGKHASRTTSHKRTGRRGPPPGSGFGRNRGGGDGDDDT